MKNINQIQKNIESLAKAPSEVKQRTFKKIEQLNPLFELLGFYSSIPKTFIEKE